MVEKNMHYEDTLKMEWNDKYKKKCMENTRSGRTKVVVGVIIMLIVISFIISMF